jgi:hypothetical protein
MELLVARKWIIFTEAGTKTVILGNGQAKEAVWD